MLQILNLIIISSSLVFNILDMEVEKITYLILKSTSEDLIFLVIGLMVAFLLKWSSDNTKFDKKTKDARVLTSESFKLKYKRPPPFYKKAKWNWSIWWRENDQKIIMGFGISTFLVLSLPYGWEEVLRPICIKMGWGFLEGVKYNSFLSGLIGASGNFIMRFIRKKERENLGED